MSVTWKRASPCGWRGLRDLARRRLPGVHHAGLALLRLNVVALLHAFDQRVEHLLTLLVVHVAVLLLHLLVEELAGFHELLQRLAQVFQRMVAVEFLELRERVLKTGVEQEVAERLHQVVHLDAVSEVAVKFGVACALHALRAVLDALRACGLGVS